MTSQLQQEINELIEIMRGDPYFTEDNPGMTARDYQFSALMDIRGLGYDSGGFYEFVDDSNRAQAARWRKIYKEAGDIIADEFADEHTVYQESAAAIDKEFHD